MLNPSLMDKVRNEIKTQIIGSNTSSNANVLDLLDYENSTNLTYTGYCFYESLRIEPPVHLSTPLCFSEDCQIGNYTIKEGH